MIKKPHVLLTVFVFTCGGLGIRPAVAQLSAEITVDVTEVDGLFTYEYTVANSILSSGAISAFLLSVANGSDVVDNENGRIAAPEGWVGEYLAAELSFQVGYVAGDGIVCSDPDHNITPGGVTTFTLTSRYAPGMQDYFAAEFTADCLETVGDPIDGQLEAPTVPPEIPTLACDVDGDGVCDLVDIDALGVAIAAGNNESPFDLTEDGLVDIADLEAFLVDEQVNRLNGDADFNGTVDFIDFLVLSNNFGRENIPWSGGNFVPSANVDFADFLTLSENFGQAPAAAGAAIPEPSAISLLAVTAVSLCCLRRKGYA